MNRIICGDNLKVLKTFPDEYVDLIYIDPPFFTSKNYVVIWNNGEELRQFADSWITEKENGTGRAKKDINVFLEWMKPRIEELHRVLKKTGSFYLHCDYHANSYLRMICDEIFGYNNLQNEIIWHYSGTGNPTQFFKRKHDTIFFYSKTENYTFNPIKTNPTNKSTIKRYDMEDEKGRYKLWNTRGTIRKVYMKPLTIDDVWDINVIGATSKERLGYPTQKPEALLERIIIASSNENDIILDAFAGGGTTLAVASRLKRRYIGIEVSPTACRLMAKRLQVPKSTIEGLPATPQEIAEMGAFEFQNWVNRELCAKSSATMSSDSGIDGWLGEVPIQVKQSNVGRPVLDNFVASILRARKNKGIFVALGFSSTFKVEVARLKAEQGITILPITIEDIVEKRAVSKIKKEKMAPKGNILYARNNNNHDK